MVNFILMNLLSFVLGVVSSMVASYFYDGCRANRVRGKFKSLDGYWFEEISDSKDRRYSIGRFQYNKHKRGYSFDGTNYLNSGEIFCTWESIQVHFDIENRKIYYIFRACLKGARYYENYGFGVVNVEESENGQLTPVSGHYIETKEDARPHSHSMVRLGRIISSLKMVQSGADTAAFHSQIIKRYDSQQAVR